MVVDTHVHVVSDDLDRYPLRPAGIGSDWFLTRPVTAERLVELMDDAGVERAALVQAVGAYGTDNAYTVDAARARPDRFTAVVVIDVDDDPVARLGALHAGGGVTGVRLFAIGRTWLDDARTYPLWRAAHGLGLTVVVTILPDQIGQLDAALDAHPGVPVALDHCAFADAAALAPLARHGNLRLKVTPHVVEHMDDLVATFGRDRLLWGSDFPQHEGTYAALTELGRRAFAHA